ncbi:MAG: GntR family transcriptional regulator [Christensenellales bacterium]|jgi:DNA-binding GntR family transcriptional regulator
MRTQSLKMLAYNEIKSRIVEGIYKPGDFLNEKAIADGINVSRTPVREAIVALERENLVRVVPKRGVMVCDITAQDVLEAYQVRELVEPYIIRAFGPLVEKERLKEFFKEKFESDISDENIKEMNVWDDEFHIVLSNACPNRYIQSMLKEIHIQNYRIRMLTNIEPARLEISSREHLEVINYMLEDNFEKAACSMVEHLKAGKQATVMRLSRAYI